MINDPFAVTALGQRVLGLTGVGAGEDELSAQENETPPKFVRGGTRLSTVGVSG
jgi:hypothetical protein